MLPPPIDVIKPMKVTPNQSGFDFWFAAMAPDIAKNPVPDNSSIYWMDMV
jgi:hypothetical protein